MPQPSTVFRVGCRLGLLLGNPYGILRSAPLWVDKKEAPMVHHPTGTILDAIGQTPLLEIQPGIWAKCEFLNPSGSIKARMALYLINRAEAEGLLRPGDTIVEATSGNTGNAMAMVAAVKGYKMLVLLPEGFTQERTTISKAFGAEVRHVGHFQVNDAMAEAKRLGQQPGYYCPQQFDNDWNVEENRTWLGPEILKQLPASVKLDALCQGVGTGGTLIGVAQALRAHHNHQLLAYAVEPTESQTLALGQVADHQIEGIADGFVPGLYARYAHEVNGTVAIASAEAVAAMRQLATTHGLFVGPSSGANLLAAQRLRRQGCANVLTFLCDEGEKYIMKYHAPGHVV